MKTVEDYLADERIRSAVDELKLVISAKFPGVKFEPYVWDDPEGLYLRTEVDIDDTDEVTDLVIDRQVRMYFDVSCRSISSRFVRRSAGRRWSNSSGSHENA